MKRYYAPIAILCFGIVVLSNVYGCKKEPDTASQRPLDSLVTRVGPVGDDFDTIDTKTTASKNSIDSIIGTYYGNRERHDTNFSSSTHSTYVNYSGPDTIDIVREGTDKIGLSGRRNHGYGQLFPYVFIFDTSRVLNDDRYQTSTLYVFPEKDSISYVYKSNSGIGYQVTGWVVVNTFTGKKR